MERETLVYLDLSGSPIFVGRLWSRSRNNRESATFEYAKEWLTHPLHFALEPGLTLNPGPFHSGGKTLFGAIGDSAPDRWGRALMRRAELRRAAAEKRTPRSLQEVDYLLMVDDEVRQGALRFAAKLGGPFLATSGRKKIPPLLELPALLTASENVLNDTESEEDLRLLLAPGSSLGGARPKASVRDRDGQLMVAKFPHDGDEINTVLWEAVALTLAEKAGISVPQWRLESVGQHMVLLSRRFDRVNKTRIPFLSAMSMLNAKDNEVRSYLELVDLLRRYGSAPQEDMRMLWSRIVFNILISNTDDHLRNHAFLHNDPAGWRLAPAYDLNPVPVDIKPRVLSTAIDVADTTASLELAMKTSAYFHIKLDDARQISCEIGSAVKQWRNVAKGLGLTNIQIDRMSSAFEHADLKIALVGKTAGRTKTPEKKTSRQR